MSKIAAVVAIASVANAQVVLPYTSTVLPATSTVLPATSVLNTSSLLVAPQQPPRYLAEPGIQLSTGAGFPSLPASYDFPYEQTTINTSTGLLTRTSGTPLPPVPNLVKHSDGLWYQAPTNSWQYVGSPLQPYNQAVDSSPYVGKIPSAWALLNNDNLVNLSTGEIFNNPYTPVPQMEVLFKDNLAYAAPKDPFNFMESPFQPYNYPDTHAVKPVNVPPMVPAGEIGFKTGYNPQTIDILKQIQGLPLNYNYDLNSAQVLSQQQVGVSGIPGVPVV